MKFVLKLDEKLIIKYARHLEYDENELNDINEIIFLSEKGLVVGKLQTSNPAPKI